MGHFLGGLGQGFVVIAARGVRVQGEVELVVPAELEAGFGQGVVADLGGRVSLGEVGGVGGNLVGDDAFLDVVAVGQAEVFFRRDIAEHGGAVPADHCGADAGGEVVVAGGDVGDQGAEGVEGGFVAVLQLLVHIFLDELHGYMARPFDHHLDVVFPGDFGEFAEGFQFGELGGVVGVGDGAGAQPVAEGEGHVVLPHNLAHFGEVFVEEAFAVVGEAPFGHNGAAAGDDAGDAVDGHGDIGEADAGVDGEVVHALFGLFDEGVAEDFPGQVFGFAVDFFQGLVDGDAADGDGAVADDPLAGFVDVAAGGEVHHCVGAPAGGPGHFGYFLVNAGSDGGVADVGVDFDQEVASDNHWFRFGVVDVGGDDGAAGGDFGADELRGYDLGEVGAEVHRFGAAHQGSAEELLAAHIFADGDVLHFRRDDALAGVMELGDVAAGFGPAGAAEVAETVGVEGGVGQPFPPVFGGEVLELLGVVTFRNPAFPEGRQPLTHVDGDVGVGVGAGGVIDIDRGVVFHAGAGVGVVQGYFPHWHAEVGAAARFVHLAGVGEGAD